MTEHDQSRDSARTESAGNDVVALKTSGLGADEGRDEWQSVLGSLYAEMDVAWPDRGGQLDAEWGGRPFGELHVSCIRCAEQTVVRSPAMIESDSCVDFLVCVITDGHVQVRQDGRTAALDRGAFALLDLGSPFVFHSPAPFKQIAVRVPGRMMLSRLPETFTQRSTGRSFDTGSGSAAIVGRLLTDIATTEILASTAVSFASSTIEMLSAAMLEGLPSADRAESFRAQDLARIKQVISENLHDVDLTLTDVAAMSGMSLRNMQKIVSTMGRTPNGWLYEARVERAKHLLLSSDRSVAVISEQAGFRDVSHFGRLFRKHIGISPGRFRDAQMRRVAGHQGSNV